MDGAPGQCLRVIRANPEASLTPDGRLVSLDNVIVTPRQTGADMQSKYKETSLGGLAVSFVERLAGHVLASRKAKQSISDVRPSSYADVSGPDSSQQTSGREQLCRARRPRFSGTRDGFASST
jgi:hypothetical protein